MDDDRNGELMNHSAVLGFAWKMKLLAIVLSYVKKNNSVTHLASDFWLFFSHSWKEICWCFNI